MTIQQKNGPNFESVFSNHISVNRYSLLLQRLLLVLILEGFFLHFLVYQNNTPEYNHNQVLSK